MTLRTLLIDDEPIALAKLHAYVEKTPSLELAGEFSSTAEAKTLLDAEPIDLIVTDISMPDMNGLDFIRSLSNPPMVIFTTAHAQFAADSYKVSAVDYLLKPFDLEEFQRAAAKAVEIQKVRQAAADDFLFIKVDYRFVRINPANIRYIKGYGEYLQIFTTEQEQPLVTLSSFAAIRSKLGSDFLQVHRSYIVNMRHVDSIERSRLVFAPDTFIPVSDSYKSAFAGYLARHALGSKK